MQKISAEYVTIGHPDRMCDLLAAKLIEKIQDKDKKKSHAAIEVFATKDTIIFGGEATTTLKINKKLLKSIVKEIFSILGYNNEKRKKEFGKDNIPVFSKTKIINKISRQSPDIAAMTTDKHECSGYNDQGIFYGAYDSATYTGQGYAKYLAQDFGDYLLHWSRISPYYKQLGSDIKIKIDLETKDDYYTSKSISGITVAWANTYTNLAEFSDYVKSLFERWYKERELKINKDDIRWVINGGSFFRKHGFIADTSMTGRKLAVNNISAGPLYSQNQIGGGSMIKPWHASDLLLPLLGNQIAKLIVTAGYSKYANVVLSSSIGRHEIDNISFFGDKIFEKNKNLKEAIESYININYKHLSPNDIVDKWNFFDFDFSEIVKDNFISISGEGYPWEIVSKELNNFKSYIEEYISK